MEDNVDDGLVADRDYLAGVTDAGELDVCAGRHIEMIGAVHAGDGADGRVADHHHGGSDDRSARIVDDPTADCLILCGS